MKPHRPKFPTQYEKAYIKRLRARQKAIKGLLDTAIEEILRHSEEQEKALAKLDSISEVTASQLIRVFELVQRQVAKDYPVEDLTDFLKKMAEDAGRFATGQQEQVFARVMALDVTSVFRGLEEGYESWVKTNVDLIKTVDDRYFTQLGEVVDKAYASGINTRDLTKDIQKRFGVEEWNAERIARDQIGKLNAEVTQARQEQIGVKEYMWVTSNDDRVRESHEELDGTIHSWSSPPTVDGEEVHPGQAILCRCEGTPILPGETGESVREMYGYKE